MLEFSIVIPVYNGEKTLKRCLDSVCAQTFLDYEVILIDDGSSDQSWSICKSYQAKNQKFRVIHQANSGPSVARNVGLEAAMGKWVCFVDSDDFIEENYLQDIRNAAAEYDADVVFIGHHKVYEDGRKEPFIPCEVSNTKIDTLLELSKQDMFGYTWVKVFQRDSIKENRFDPQLNLFEDEVFACQVVPHCARVGVVRKPIYNYYVGNGGSLIGRTHEDYCLKCDKVYQAWKTLLGNGPEAQCVLKKKADSFVSRCYYYAFERQVNLKNYFSLLNMTAFFKEHTQNDRRDDFVRNGNYAKLYFEKMKYLAKLRIFSVLRRGK